MRLLGVAARLNENGGGSKVIAEIVVDFGVVKSILKAEYSIANESNNQMFEGRSLHRWKINRKGCKNFSFWNIRSIA